MNILLLGSGGRENALAWKMSQSSRCEKLFIAPGNAGSSRYGINVNISATDFSAVKKILPGFPGRIFFEKEKNRGGNL